MRIGVSLKITDAKRLSLNRPDTDQSFNADTAALKSVVPGNEDVVEAITVGSETLYRGNFTGQQLLGKINQVKQMFPHVTVGTADSWNKYADGTADPLITGNVTYLYVTWSSFLQAAFTGSVTNDVRL
jgi:glucan 1,3-beta-glucosidase